MNIEQLLAMHPELFEDYPPERREALIKWLQETCDYEYYTGYADAMRDAGEIRGLHA